LIFWKNGGYKMGNAKRNLLGLIAFIFGICFLVLLCVMIANSVSEDTIMAVFITNLTEEDLVKYKLDQLPYREALEILESEAFKPVAYEYWKESGGTWGYLTSNGIGIFFFIVVPILLIAAFVLNIFGWLKNGAKRMLIADILYLLSLNIPSAVLCFIGFKKLKK